jgi:cytochrome c biogenesis protein CcdA
MGIKKKIFKEAAFVIIVLLLVFLSILITGTFFGIWIRDYRLIALMVLIFYLIIGFYRILNHLARRYREEGQEDPDDVK